LTNPDAQIYLFYSSNGKLQLSSSYIKQTWYKVQIGDCMIPLYILMGKNIDGNASQNDSSWMDDIKKIFKLIIICGWKFQIKTKKKIYLPDNYRL
jgi:hypothetical protein